MASAWLVYPLLVIKIAVLFSPGSSGFVPEIHAPMDVHGHEAVLEVCLQFVQPLLGPWRVRVNARNDGEVKEGDNFLGKARLQLSQNLFSSGKKSSRGAKKNIQDFF